MGETDDRRDAITTEIVLKAYSCGIFPMAEAAEDAVIYWIEPQHRGILPIEAMHVPKRLARTVRQDHFEVRIDTDFDGVIEGCAASRPGRTTTWINRRIRELYGELFQQGHCHTIEAWREGRLVGGLYGVALGAAFFGESMFSCERDASKVALVHLVARLAAGRFQLLDTQFVTEHLSRFGTIEVSRKAFQKLLQRACARVADFHALPRRVSGAEALDILARQRATASAQ